MIETQSLILKSTLKFFESIKKPIYDKDKCPFELLGDHYTLSSVCNQGYWKWNCPLCGKEDQE